MKKVVFLISFLVIILSTAFSIAIFNRETVDLISPLIREQKVLGVNQWFPKVVYSNENAPQVSAKAAIFIDTTAGDVLYAKNIYERLPVASLVKVMTVLVALELKNLNSEYVVSQRAADMEPDKMLLIAGERLSLKELLDGIFLISANDAAEALAEGTVGSREDFINLMNNKAKQLGMKESYFANPTGLDEDIDNSYSTVYDLAILTRYLINRYPEVVDISSQNHVYLHVTDKHQDYDMHSGINLLTTYPGVVGFKTGYTPEAGLTLITLARKNGHEVMGILLGSQSRRDEARELLDYSFDKLKD